MYKNRKVTSVLDHRLGVTVIAWGIKHTKKMSYLHYDLCKEIPNCYVRQSHVKFHQKSMNKTITPFGLLSMFTSSAVSPSLSTALVLSKGVKWGKVKARIYIVSCASTQNLLKIFYQIFWNIYLYSTIWYIAKYWILWRNRIHCIQYTIDCKSVDRRITSFFISSSLFSWIFFMGLYTNLFIVSLYIFWTSEISCFCKIPILKHVVG